MLFSNEVKHTLLIYVNLFTSKVTNNNINDNKIKKENFKKWMVLRFEEQKLVV